MEQIILSITILAAIALVFILGRESYVGIGR